VGAIQLIPIALLAGLSTLIISWFTVGSHAYKVARTNPIIALRTD
jgi:hypothetical protein